MYKPRFKPGDIIELNSEEYELVGKFRINWVDPSVREGSAHPNYIIAQLDHKDKASLGIKKFQAPFIDSIEIKQMVISKYNNDLKDLINED